MTSRLSANHWKTIWNKPRQTIRNIVKTDASQQLLPLYAIQGFPILIQFAQSLNLGTLWSTWVILLAAIILSPLMGFIAVSICSILLKWTGRWIGGESNYKHIRAAVAWTNVPNLVTVVALFILIGWLRHAMFQPSSTEISSFSLVILAVLSIAQFVAAIWALVIYIVALSEVQGFSVLKAILNIIIAVVILVIVGGLLGAVAIGIQG